MIYTWEDVVAAKKGTKLVQRFDEGVCILIMRGPFHLCVYLGIPSTHPLAGHSYDDLPINCHGGLTFSGEGDGEYRPKGVYWYGWDYGHCDDYMISDHHSPEYAEFNDKRTKWGVEEVEKDMYEALYDFKHLVKLSEAIYRKAELGVAQLSNNSI